MKNCISFNLLSSKRTIVLYFLISIPPLFLLMLVLKYYVDVPYWDQWSLVPLINKYFQGTLTFQDLWNQHNEHRIIVPKIILLLVAILSDWKIIYELMLNYFFGIGIFLLITKNINSEIKYERHYHLLLLIISIVIFSPTQWENWLWGWQIAIFLNVFCVILAFKFLSNVNFRNFIMAFILGIIATFSYANGLIFWVVGFIMLINAKYQKRISYYLLFLWLLFSVLIISVYFYSYHSTIQEINFYKQPLAYIKYIFAYLGAPIVNFNYYYSIFFGFVGVSLLSVLSILYIKRGIRVDIVWVALGLYSILSAFMSSVGRFRFGIEQAMSSRYITISSLLWVSLFIIIFNLEHSGIKIYRKHTAKIILLIITITPLLINFTKSTVEFRKWHEKLMPARNELISSRDYYIMQRLYPDCDVLKEMIEIIDKYNISSLREYKHFSNYTQLKDSTTIFGRVETITSNESLNNLAHDSIFRISGWAIDPISQMPAKSIIVVCNNNIISRADIADSRRDIVEQFNNYNYIKSGWNMRVSCKEIPDGESDIKVYVVLNDGLKINEIYCERVNVISNDQVYEALINKYYIENNQIKAGRIEQIRENSRSFTFSGWAINPYTSKPAKKLLIVNEDGNTLALASVNDDRPDIAKYFQNKDLLNSGWWIRIDKQLLKHGENIIYAYALLPEGKKVIRLENQFKFIMNEDK